MTGSTCTRTFNARQQAVANVTKYLQDLRSTGDKRFNIPRSCKTPMRTAYRPELDTSYELNPKDAAYYQSLIGVLRWIVELGRVDICLETSVMSSMLALPRFGHLEQVLQIFGYLRDKHNAELVFDPTYPTFDEAAFVGEWRFLLVELIEWMMVRVTNRIMVTCNVTRENDTRWYVVLSWRLYVVRPQRARNPSDI